MRSQNIPPKAGRASLVPSIIGLIESDGLAAGDPLPPETVLTSRLGASRTSVREALRELQAAGIVDIRHGFGTLVGQGNLDLARRSLVFRARAEPERRVLLSELVEVREALELHLVALLAASTPPGLIRHLDRIVSSMGDPGKADAADQEFHDVLCRAGGNALLAELAALFWETYRDLEASLPAPPNDMVHIHRSIVIAIQGGDPDAAREATARHFDDVRARTHVSPEGHERLSPIRVRIPSK